MEQSNDMIQGNIEEKFLGTYLIEAGLITVARLNEAIKEQKNNPHMRLREILVSRGWVEQKEINYFIDRIIALGAGQNLGDRYQEKSRYNFFHPHDLTREEKTSVSDVQAYRHLSLPIFYISPKKVSQILLIVIIFLVLTSVLTESTILFFNLSTSNGYTGRMFVLDAEANIPTLYSALTLLFCSFLLAIISYIKRAEDTFYTGWKFLSGLFLFLALDEFCSIHETFIVPLRKALNTSGFLHFAWVIPATILLIIFLLSFLKFIKALPQKTRSLFILAGATYVSGALGMELVSGYYASIHGEETVAYSILTVVEELLEMLGIVVFIYALLSYIRRNVGEIRFCIRFSDNQ